MRFHLAIHKRYFRYAPMGYKGFLCDGVELTEEDAKKAIDALPGDIVPFADCDNYDADTGKCLGHDS